MTENASKVYIFSIELFFLHNEIFIARILNGIGKQKNIRPLVRFWVKKWRTNTFMGELPPKKILPDLPSIPPCLSYLPSIPHWYKFRYLTFNLCKGEYWGGYLLFFLLTRGYQRSKRLKYSMHTTEYVICCISLIPLLINESLYSKKARVKDWKILFRERGQRKDRKCVWTVLVKLRFIHFRFA